MSSKVQPETFTFRKGDVIFQEGAVEMFLYDIQYGSVGIYSKYGTPEEKLLTTLEGGQQLGEMGFIEARPRSATAVALDKTMLSKITAENFSDYFQEKPAKLLLIMQQMSGRIRELSNDYLSACQTISEYLDAEAQNQPKSESLLTRMKKFVGIYKSGK